MGRPRKTTAGTVASLSIDEQVKKALEVIEQKKKDLAADKARANRTWTTNGELTLNGVRFQLQTLDLERLILAAAALENYYATLIAGATALFGDQDAALTAAPTRLQGFTYQEWLQDMQTRLAKIQLTEKSQALAALEARAKQLQSEDAKRAASAEALVAELGL